MPRIRLALAFSAVLSTAAVAQSAPDWSGAAQVPVVMKSYSFTPATLALRAGQPYRLELTNSSSSGHSFAAQEFFKAVVVAPEDQGKIKDGEVEVDGNGTAEIRFVPRAAGQYKFKCTHFLHASFGMTGTITVE